MPLLAWNDNLSVGVRSIDGQHLQLVTILNNLYDAMTQGHAKEVTGPLLRKLVNYTRDHFSAEEAMMVAAKYPSLTSHRHEHDKLTKQVESYVERFDRGECTVNIELLRFLRTWLTDHIQHSDKAYAPCMIEHGIH